MAKKKELPQFDMQLYNTFDKRKKLYDTKNIDTWHIVLQHKDNAQKKTLTHGVQLA
jgi:hypothetical protein